VLPPMLFSVVGCVVTLGEIRQGVERLRPRDGARAGALEKWLEEVRLEFAGRVLPVDLVVAQTWGRISARRSTSVIEGLLAATALAHELTLVTRNVADFVDLGAKLMNPFAA
jgi:toxin FitB